MYDETAAASDDAVSSTTSIIDRSAGMLTTSENATAGRTRLKIFLAYIALVLSVFISFCVVYTSTLQAADPSSQRYVALRACAAACAVAGALSALFAIVGVVHRRPTFLLPYLVTTVVGTVISLSYALLYLVAYMELTTEQIEDGVNETTIVLHLFKNMATTVLGLGCLHFVHSCYSDLYSRRGTAYYF